MKFQHRNTARRTVATFIGAIGMTGLVAAGTLPTGASAAAKPHGVNLSQLQADVTAASAQPTFKTFASQYGAKLKNPSKLRGMKLMIIPGNSALAACEEIAQADANIAKAMGMTPFIFQTTGLTTQYNSAIQQAIDQGYKAIDLECDFNPATVAPGIAQAQAKGIKVVVYGATSQEMAQSKANAGTVDPYAADGKVAAEDAVLQHKGKPFQAISITSNEAPATALLQGGFDNELKKICPACKDTQYNIEVPQWQTNIASTLTSALIKNPQATVVVPDYAGMLTYILAGIQAAHRTSTVKTYLAFGGGTPFIKMQVSGLGHQIIQNDIGGYPVWTGYLLFYQTALVLTGQKTIPYASAWGPNRVATPQNARQMVLTGGWGTDFVNGFHGLLKMRQLTGASLFKAATLGGIMTSTV